MPARGPIKQDGGTGVSLSEVKPTPGVEWLPVIAIMGADGSREQVPGTRASDEEGALQRSCAMRSLMLPALFGACLAAIATGPSEAAKMASHGQGPAATALLSSAATQQSVPRIPHSRAFFGFPFAFGSPVTTFAPGDFAGLDGGTQPLVVTSAAPPVAVNTRPSVETTPEGVTIVRGTGSHHIRR